MNDRVQRPANAPDPNHVLLRAARANDDRLDLGEDFDKVIGSLSIGTANELMYIAEQRALRYCLILSGRLSELQAANATERPAGFSFTAEERQWIDRMVPLFVDAMAIGARARMFAEDDMNENGALAEQLQTEMDPVEIRFEAERVIGEDRVPTDVLAQIIADFGDHDG